MELLQKYCKNELFIDGLRTYIVSPGHYEDVLHDTQLLNQLELHSAEMKNAISVMINYAAQIHEIKVHFAFVQHENRKRYIWEPVNVCEYEGRLYHIFIKGNWVCIPCGHNHYGKIIMPMAEADILFFDDKKQTVTPTLFKKIPCDKCGKLLQNHLFIIK